MAPSSTFMVTENAATQEGLGDGIPPRMGKASESAPRGRARQSGLRGPAASSRPRPAELRPTTDASGVPLLPCAYARRRRFGPGAASDSTVDDGPERLALGGPL